jgi:hypothetical protein
MSKSSFLMRRLRAILLTDYIGAILIALLATQAIIVFFTALVQQISYYTHLAEHSLTGPAFRSSHWEPVLASRSGSSFIFSQHIYWYAGFTEGLSLEARVRAVRRLQLT